MCSQRLKLLSLTWIVFAFAVTASAQTTRQLPVVPDPVEPVRAPVPWMVTVAHVIPLDEIIQEYKNRGIQVSTADGNAGEVQVLNITTGIAVDAKNHVLVRLVNLKPGKSVVGLTVHTIDHRSLSARLVGIDGITGLSILEVPGLDVDPPELPSTPVTPASDQAVQVWMPIFDRAQPKRDRKLEISRLRVLSGQVRRVTSGGFDLLMRQKDSIDGQTGGIVVGPDNRLLGITLDETDPLNLSVLPIGTAVRAFQRVINAGRSIPRGWLGIGGEDIAAMPEDRRKARKITLNQGVWVSQVLPQSPAELAGIKPFDTFEALNGQPIQSLKEFLEVLGQQPAGFRFSLTVLRDGKKMDLPVVLGEREYRGLPLVQDPLLESVKAQVKHLQKVEREYHVQLESATTDQQRTSIQQEIDKIEGMIVSAVESYRQFVQSSTAPRRDFLGLGLGTSELTRQLSQFFGAETGGVLVQAVEPDGPAKRAGIQVGDVLVEINGEKIHNIYRFNRLVFTNTLPTMVMRLLRGKKEVTVKIDGVTSPMN